MHIFLTGDFQVGKSTIIGRVLEQLPHIAVSGFLTQKHRQQEELFPSVYMLPVRGGRAFTEENRVGICGRPSAGPNAFPEVFDKRGLELLKDADSAQLIIMDEIGKMERNAAAFSGRIRELLDGDRPILGVVRQEGSTPLLETVRAHPNVRLLVVTEENREGRFAEALKLVKWEVNRYVDSAGALVFDGGRVLMVSARGGKWGFPKGHLERGETARQAAVREVYEETGIQVALDGEFAVDSPSALPGEHRKVTFFLGTPTGGVLAPQLGEVADAAWKPLSDVPGLLRFPSDLEVFQAALRYYGDR